MTIKLEFSASVGFIHKEFVTMHDHTILKWLNTYNKSVVFDGKIYITIADCIHS
jgi:hypothetical protein